MGGREFETLCFKALTHLDRHNNMAHTSRPGEPGAAREQEKQDAVHSEPFPT